MLFVKNIIKGFKRVFLWSTVLSGLIVLTGIILLLYRKKLLKTLRKNQINTHDFSNIRINEPLTRKVLCEKTKKTTIHKPKSWEGLSLSEIRAQLTQLIVE